MKGKVFYKMDPDGYISVGVAEKVDDSYVVGVTSYFSPEGRWLHSSRGTYDLGEVVFPEMKVTIVREQEAEAEVL